MSQKKFVIASILLAALSAAAFVPFIARNVDFDVMASVSFILFFNAFLGAFDVLKPVLIKDFSRTEFQSTRIPIRGYLNIVVLLGMVVVTLLQLARACFFDHLIGGLEGLFISAAVLCYFLASIPWSALDASGRVGTAQLCRSTFVFLLYLSYFCLSWLNMGLAWYAFFFFLSHALILSIFIVLARGMISFKLAKPMNGQLREIWSTTQLNASKIVIDFSDRLVLAKFLPAAAFAAYAGLYEITSKINIVPQYYNAYTYPILCKNFSLNIRDESFEFARMHFSIAAINFFVIVCGGLLLYPFFDVFISLYLGEKYKGNSEVLGVLLASAAVYSLAFYSQSFFRSIGRFSELSRAYIKSMMLGLLSMPFFLWGLGLDGLIFSVIILKSSGVGVFAVAVREIYGKLLMRVGGIAVSSSIAILIGLIQSRWDVAVAVGFLLALSYYFGAAPLRRS